MNIYKVNSSHRGLRNFPEKILF